MSRNTLSWIPLLGIIAFSRSAAPFVVALTPQLSQPTQAPAQLTLDYIRMLCVLSVAGKACASHPNPTLPANTEA